MKQLFQNEQMSNRTGKKCSIRDRAAHIDRARAICGPAADSHSAPEADVFGGPERTAVVIRHVRRPYGVAESIRGQS